MQLSDVWKVKVVDGDHMKSMVDAYKRAVVKSGHDKIDSTAHQNAKKLTDGASGVVKYLELNHSDGLYDC